MLKVGSSLGPYEITGALGAGAMGVVFSGHDARLGRNVALKVLPEAFAADPERIKRFEREARLLAALAHPHIASLYGLEDSGGTRAIVMELVDGETLTQRIARASLPQTEALDLARQLAEALDYAHERGILHRDLKPDNLKITPEGQLKVLDFGLAKALDPTTDVPRASTSNTPTVTSAPSTESGTVLGTAAYMAPEQARGKVLDRRADIWAFGCVLYEMLAGRCPFRGETVADVLAAVMTQEPDLTALPRSTSTSVTALIQQCLQKDPKRRLRDIGDALGALNVMEGNAGTLALHQPQRRPPARVLPWAISVASIAATVLWSMGARVPVQISPRVTKVEALVGADASLVSDQGPSASLSADGAVLAYTARNARQVRQLYVRRLDQLDATPLNGTEDAHIPMFSPDGQWVAFFAEGKLKKVSVSGGQVVVLCDAPTGRGGSWGDDGWIVFTPNASGGTVLHRVNSNGGSTSTVTTLREGEAAHRWPQVLPGARGVLYSTTQNLGNYNDGEVVVQPLPAGTPKVLVRGGYFGRYAHSGHITYVRDGRLFAVPFDLVRLEVTGEPVPVLERVSTAVQSGAAQFDLSAAGTAVYVAEERGLAQPLQWLSRDGVATPLVADPFDWSNPRISPDGQRVALDRFDGQQTDIWVYDFTREALDQLTFDPGEDWMPVWTPDGGRITFRSTRRQFAFNLHWQPSTGAGQSEAITNSRSPLAPSAWHPRGDTLAYLENNPATNYDIVLMPLSQTGGPAGPPRPLLNTPALEMSPAFSPDGRWIAYVSNESGRPGVYVRPYPAPAGKWLVAAEGTDPVWSRTRPEIVFLGPDRRLMVSRYSVAGDSFRPEQPQPWAAFRAVSRTRGLIGFDGRAFDLHPDGVRALGAWIPESASVSLQSTVVLAFNFSEELQRLAPAPR